MPADSAAQHTHGVLADGGVRPCQACLAEGAAAEWERWRKAVIDWGGACGRCGWNPVSNVPMFYDCDECAPLRTLMAEATPAQPPDLRETKEPADGR